ncbi:hypothetical protein NFHSH190041_17890 [Shewanella sp. NFH-SH190041]|nr:hypothetical protein NFHSH190041_17890 [Shewanella sp. NFH-SH190041]
MQITTTELDPRQVRIAISAEKLAQLMAGGHLCAAEIKCLDSDTKQQVWQTCLHSCSQRLGCGHCRLQCANMLNYQTYKTK